MFGTGLAGLFPLFILFTAFLGFTAHTVSEVAAAVREIILRRAETAGAGRSRLFHYYSLSK